MTHLSKAMLAELQRRNYSQTTIANYVLAQEQVARLSWVNCPGNQRWYGFLHLVRDSHADTAQWPNWREVAGDEMQVTCSSHIYRTAARALALTVFNAPFIQSVCVRRSVASGEAVFPFSDMDFDITITSDSGLLIERLRKRYSLAKILFPRTGHCFVMTSADPNEISVTEPYRASINQRCFFLALGVPPSWPVHPIQPLEAARRVVFWLEHFFPTAVRRGQHRNQRKFYLEMCNALGLIEGKWSEPRVYSREVEQAYPLPSDSLFARGLNVAAKAHGLLDRRAPRIGATFHAPGLTILPTPESAWPPEALVDHGVVTTPESLDLLLQTQCPALWLHHGQALSALGFDTPSRMAWIRSARRLAGSLWLRGPGRAVATAHGEVGHVSIRAHSASG